MTIPTSLKTWFTIHFIADMIFGIPLLLAPYWTLQAFGFEAVEPVTARLVGAALIGIGGVSLLAKNASIDSYRSLLSLKLIWSLTAVFGLSLSLIETEMTILWLFIAIFSGFFLIWQHYYRKLKG